MVNKVFNIVTNSDRGQALEVSFLYPMNCAKNKWLDEVKAFSLGYPRNLRRLIRKSRER